MARPVIIGGPARLWEYAIRNTADLFKQTGNTGNLAFRYAIYKHLGRTTRVLPWRTPVEVINQSGQIAVIPCANHLGSHEDFGWRADRVEQYDIPALAIGLGAQSSTREEFPDIPAGTRRFVAAIAERRSGNAPNITVRGEFSRQVLDRLGIQDGVEVLGCPSLFINDARDLGQIIAHRLEHKIQRIAIAGGNPDRGFDSSLEQQLYAMACQSGGSYIVQDPLPFIRAARGEFESLDSTEKDKLRKYLGIESSAGEGWGSNIITFFDIDAWLENLRQHDLVIGMRIHGTLLALQCGIPALCITHDSRTEELCETMKIPFVSFQKLSEGKIDIPTILRHIRFDPDEFDNNRIQLAKKYVEIFEGNGLVAPKGLDFLVGEIKQIQKNNVTTYNRHPDVFSAVRKLMADSKVEKILSFGCSNGDEPLSLAELWFKDAWILGLDVDDKCLTDAVRKTQGLRDRIKISYSTQRIIEKSGPFDVVFAMSEGF